MLKINELKTLRKNNRNDIDSEADSVQIEKNENISNNSKYFDKDNKTSNRLEIDASNDNENYEQNEEYDDEMDHIDIVNANNNINPYEENRHLVLEGNENMLKDSKKVILLHIYNHIHIIIQYLISRIHRVGIKYS